MQRLVKVDGKVRTDSTYPSGFMDIIRIDKTNENFRLVYDTKGRFVVHAITGEEAAYKLAKVKRQQLGRNAVPYIVTHDGRTLRYPDPDIKVGTIEFCSAPAHAASMASAPPLLPCRPLSPPDILPSSRVCTPLELRCSFTGLL